MTKPTYPQSDELLRFGYCWCSEKSKQREIQRYIAEGRTEAWILREAERFARLEEAFA